MGNDRNQDIRALIQRLKGDVEMARDISLDLTIRLLQMAILDLQAVMISMSDDDLRYLADAIEDATSDGTSLTRLC
jgi:hypothetical protein